MAFVATSAALVLASCSSSTSSAVPAKTLTKTTNVTIALPIDLPPQSPVFLAQKLGYFQKNHLNVTIPIVSGDVAANSALVAGSVQYTSVNAVSLFAADEKDIPLQAICMEYDGVGYALAANNAFAASHHLTSHSSPKAVFSALKGQTVATVGGASAAPGLMLTGLLQYYGFPSNWLTDLSLSGASDLLTAVQHGEVAALFNGQPTPTEAADTGAGTVVFNTTELSGLTQLPWEGIMGLRSYVSSHPAVDRAVCRSIGEADDYLIAHPSSATSALLSNFASLGRTDLLISLKTFNWAHDGTMSTAGWNEAATDLLRFHLISQAVPKSVLRKAYTTAYLPG